MLKYREKFNLTPDEFRKIDLKDVLTDFEWYKLESELSPKTPENSQNE